ncbi:TetR/AcrR family transcriptional regulator [Haloarchaeobius iranensis]|uniref:DNA-binding transcriptional regulator, AcrR family n=1 Tax=Haloarchaeobius iranensis TaxID=996166 RepID=A0A1G9YEQ5_9EURY|nr:TetR/AcrR family transcriptional regulator [Haloarchaeobius iranensis]SDN07639.1 DNA-binding transcriptional regulator, AcrR family [Haloarchaeobius iranensis]
MSGGFSDAERERIREQLVVEGRELFSRYGLSKTTLADLTEPVGIATSTFYQFFDSKEELYLEILDREGERLLPELLGPFEEYDDPETAIVGFLTGLMDEIETNPLLHQLVMDADELDRLRDQHTEAELREEREESLAYFLPYVEAWYEAGEVDGPSPEVVANAIRSVSFLTLHRDDIGRDRYRETRDLVIRAVARGLTA